MIKQKQAQDIVDDLKEINKQWIAIKKYLMKAFTKEPVTTEIEQQFLDTKSKTSKYLRVLAQKIDPHQFKYEPDKITGLLRQAISIVHLRGLPLADRKNLVVLWHEVFIRITQVLGAFEFIATGYQPMKKERKDTSIAALKKGASSGGKEEKEGSGKTIIIVVLVILIVGAVFIVLKGR